VRHGCDQQIDALHRLEPPDRQHIVAVRPRRKPPGELRWMIERFGGDAVELREPSGGVARIGEYRAAFPEHLVVEPQQRVAESDVEFGVREVAVFGSAELVGCPVLVYEPRHLLRVADEVGREL
jgi:hypothetical protein